MSSTACGSLVGGTGFTCHLPVHNLSITPQFNLFIPATEKELSLFALFCCKLVVKSRIENNFFGPPFSVCLFSMEGYLFYLAQLDIDTDVCIIILLYHQPHYMINNNY